MNIMPHRTSTMSKNIPWEKSNDEIMLRKLERMFPSYKLSSHPTILIFQKCRPEVSDSILAVLVVSNCSNLMLMICMVLHSRLLNLFKRFIEIVSIRYYLNVSMQFKFQSHIFASRSRHMYSLFVLFCCEGFLLILKYLQNYFR